MNEVKVSVVNFLFREDLKALQSAIDLLSFHEKKTLKSANEVLQGITPETGTLVVASLVDKNDLIEIATLVKMSKKIPKEASYKIIVVNFSKNQAYEKAIENLGIKDLLEPGLNTKAFKFKLDFHFKAIASKLKREIAQNNEKTLKNDNQVREESKVSNNRQMIWDPPLELTDDIWLTRDEGDVKFIFSRWLVKLMGPGPYAGQWNEEKNGIWRFDFRPGEKGAFVLTEGIWFYKGEQRPEFDIHENLWFFTGDNFELFFSNENQNFSRVKCVKKELHVCKNSSHAKLKEKSMYESFDKEITFSKEADKFKDMEGESSTDTIEQGPLKGKTNAPVDHLTNLTGKSGQGEKTESDDQGPLGGKSKTSHLSTFWEGKLETGDEEKEGEESEVDSKNESYSSDSLKGNIKTEASGDEDSFNIDIDGVHSGSDLDMEADNEFQKYYKNHNEAKKYGTKDLPKGGLGTKSEIEENDELFVDLTSGDEQNLLDEITQSTAESAENLFSKTDEVTGEFKVICYIICGGHRIKCNLYDFFDDLIIYLAQKASIQESNKVDLDMMFSFKDDKKNLKMIGDVVSIENDDEGSLFVCVKISSEDVKVFESFMKHYQRRQINITKFLNRAKGVA